MVRLATLLLVLALAVACDRSPRPAAAAASVGPESRPQSADGAPKIEATIVRDGDGVYVILDVPRTDARGRAIDPASVRIADLPAGAMMAPPEVTASRVAVELRAKARLDHVTVLGTSEGTPWSARVDVRLDG